MYKVGDKVKFVKLNFVDKSLGLSLDGIYKIDEMDSNDGTICVRLDNNERHWVYKNQLKKVEESKEMTFPEMVQKLIDGEFEVGTELINLEKVYYVVKGGLDDYGITKDKNSWVIEATFGINQLNTLWTANEYPIKEMSIEELQKELGYKIKIVEHESK